MAIVAHKSISVVSEPKQPQINNNVFTTPPQFLIDYKYTGAALEDSIYVVMTNTLAAFVDEGYNASNELQTGRTDFNYAIKEEVPIVGSDKEWTTVSEATYTPNSFVKVTDATGAYNKMLVKIESYPVTDPKTYVGTFTLIQANSQNYLLLSSPLTTAESPVPIGHKLWIPDVERHNTIQLFFTGALLPAGKYSIEVKIIHKQTGTVLHTEYINFLYDSSKSFDSNFVEHQWAYITSNPDTGEYDRLIISTDKPTIFTNIKGKMSKSIYVRGIRSIYDDVIDDSKAVSFTTKTAVNPDDQERQPT